MSVGKGSRRPFFTAKVDKAFLRYASDVGVCLFLFCDRTFPPRHATVGLVIVSGEEPGLVRKGENLLNRAPRPTSPTARKVRLNLQGHSFPSSHVR